MVLELGQAQFIGTLFGIALPSLLFYFIIEKNIKKSILFTIVFAGISGILFALFKIFALQNIIPIKGNIQFFLWGLAITGATIFLSFNIMGEKVKLQKILFVTGGYTAIIAIMLFFVIKNVDLSQLMSII